MHDITLEWDANSCTPKYEQLYSHLAELIISGQIRPDEKLPTKRTVCRCLGISRNTVENAYELLRAEGYIYSKARSGYFAAACTPRPSENETLPDYCFNARKEYTPHSFSTSAVDTTLFPYSSWARLFKETVYNGNSLLQRGDGRGDIELRQAICRMLMETRGVIASPDQLLIGAGIEYLLDLIVRLFPENTVFASESPGYPGLMRSVPNRFCPISTDSHGLDVTLLSKTDASVVLVTPSHQFPLGITMPIGRRTELLAWAHTKDDRYIIEDDYDSEFRYNSRPIRSLQGLDRGERVIYLGTFSRSLASSIRIAYAVLPCRLMQTYNTRFGTAASTVSRFEQQTLAAFIDGGLYARHLRRMNNLYRSKQSILLEELKKIPHLRISGQDAGLHFVIELTSSDEEINRSAANMGLKLHYVSQYFLDGTADKKCRLVIGFAGIEQSKLTEAAKTLADLITASEGSPQVSTP